MTWPDWKPVRVLLDLEHELEDAFSSFIDRPWGRSAEESLWHPDVDIDETDDQYIVTADLPGVRETELTLSVEPWQISVTGRRPRCRQVRTATRLQVERVCGTFRRTFMLDHAVSPRSLRTELKDGILEIRVDKEPEPKKAEHER